MPEKKEEEKQQLLPVKYTADDAMVADMRNRLDHLEIAEGDKHSYELVRMGARECVKARTGIEAERKLQNEGALAFQKYLNGEAKRLTVDIRQIEDGLKAKKKVVDDEKERIKNEKEKAERLRTQAIRNKIADIGAQATGQVNTPSDDISDTLAAVMGMEIGPEEFQELTPDAERAKAHAVASLNATLKERLQLEEERAQAEEDRRQLEIEKAQVKKKQEEEFKAEKERLRKVGEENEKEVARLKKARDDHDAKVKADEEERKRVQGIRTMITMIQSSESKVIGASTDAIRTALKVANGWNINEKLYGQFMEEAQSAKEDAVARLHQALTDRLQFDEEQAQIAKDKKYIADEKERIAREKFEAQAKKDADEKAKRELAEEEERKKAEATKLPDMKQLAVWGTEISLAVDDTPEIKDQRLLSKMHATEAALNEILVEFLATMCVRREPPEQSMGAAISGTHDQEEDDEEE